jgi:hypothetical protein
MSLQNFSYIYKKAIAWSIEKQKEKINNNDNKKNVDNERR